ncbi:MAG: Gfo/Idh/MocA family oxidoreductase [Syntrophales bacterium]
MKTYRAAVVGLGKIAWKLEERKPSGVYGALTHAGAFAASGRTQLVGGMSPDAEERRAFESHLGVPAFKTLDEMLALTQAEVVSVCSPVETHAEYTAELVGYGVPMIWLEKPPATSVAEIDSLLKLQKTNGRSKILVNYPRRYSDNYRYLREIYAGRRYGRPLAINLTYSRGLVQNGSHILDAALLVAGARAEGGSVKVLVGDSSNPSFAFMLQGGVQVIVTGLSLEFHAIDITVTFGSGRFSLLHGGQTGITEIKSEQDHFPGFHQFKQSDADPFPGSPPERHFPEALRDLVDAYENDREPLSNLDTARQSQALIEEVMSLL